MALINYVTQIQLEFGAIACIQSECERLGLKRPMIVTDAGVRAAGLVDRVLAHLKNSAEVGVYDQTPPNPHEAAVLDALALYRKGHYDGLIALGGGSAMDLAKAVAVMATQTSPTTGQRYGVSRVCQIWALARSSFYAARQQKAAVAPPPPRQRRRAGANPFPLQL